MAENALMDLDLDLDVFSPRGTHGSIKGRTVYTRVIGLQQVISSLVQWTCLDTGEVYGKGRTWNIVIDM